jgi:phosphatidylserine decarboxylase
MVVYGYLYGGAMAAAGAGIALLLGWHWAVPFYALAALCLHFFRDPERHPPPGPVAVSPADGKVVALRQDDAGGSHLGIFLNIFDVHVNRTPIPGKIVCVQYKRGRFLPADQEQASSANEQNVITVEGVAGGRPTRVVFSQIAGLIARRIVCYKRPGDLVGAAERVGLIKFGSRVDVWLGPEWEVTVRRGQRVRAGSTVIAKVRDAS